MDKFFYSISFFHLLYEQALFHSIHPFSVILTFSGISVFLFPVSFSFPFSTNSTSIFVIFSREPNFERRRFLLNTRPLCAEAYTNNISFFRPLNSAFFSQLSISFIISLAVFV